MYGIASQTILNPLITNYCNSLLRIWLNVPRRTKARDLYIEYNTFPVNFLFNFFTMKLMHRCIYNPNSLPNAIVNLFNSNINIHNHNTRSKYDLHISSSYSAKSISYYGPSMWSKLPLHLREIPNLKSFLTHYRIHLQHNL